MLIAKVVDSIVTECTRKDKEYMECWFPRVRGYPYLGAAHGIKGVVYMLMKALQVVPILAQNSSYLQKLKATLQNLIEVEMTPTGSFTFL